MSDITVTGNESYFNKDASFFKDVYIYGILHYDFKNSPSVEFGDVSITNSLSVSGVSTFNDSVFINKDLFVSGITSIGGTTFLNNDLQVSGITSIGGTTFLNNDLQVSGISTFNNNVSIAKTADINVLFVNDLTVRNRLNVGINGSTFNADTSTNRIGINSLSPEQTFDVIGNAKIKGQLYDFTNSPGVIGDFLTKDAEGIKWITFEPDFIEGIAIYNDEVLIGVNTYKGINLKTGRGLGTNTDPIQAFENPQNQYIADFYVYDYWDFNNSGDIYRNTKVGIGNSNPQYGLDVNDTVNITETLTIGGQTSITSQITSTDKDTGALIVDGGVGIEENLNVGQKAHIYSTETSTDKDTGALIVDGGVGIEENLNVGQKAHIYSTETSTNVDNGSLIVDGGVGIAENLNVGGNTKITGSLELDSYLVDINDSIAETKFDYRLSSVGIGVSWRPPGVQTQNAIWVTVDGNDSNSGYLEGDAKKTIGSAAEIAEPGDTIFVRSGVYYENNPIGLRTDVSISGQDLRLVTIVPLNRTKDVFHVRRGCLIENLSFAGDNISIAYTGAGAVAFPPTQEDIDSGNFFGAESGYTAVGPANEGPSLRWRSPYIRNCTNFMSKSIGMKINGNHAVSNFGRQDGSVNIGNDLKCMVCDSFTQYNENGIGVSITNNAYAQLVSIFTINCDIGIYCDTGGSCDLTNSNSSFGNYGLYADGLGKVEYTGIVGTYPPTRTQPGVDSESDIITFENVKDNQDNPGISTIRIPYDGQAVFIKIDLNNYADAVTTGLSTTILENPMVLVQEIKVLNGGYGFSPASPPTIIVRDSSDLSQQPKGPQGIIAELSPTIDEITGTITAIDVINSGRNYLPTQNLEVFIDGGDAVGAAATVISQPIYYTIDAATQTTYPTGITTVTFNEFIPYELFGGEEVEFRRISRILTSSHSFEYIGSGTDINTATPFTGGTPIKENEIVALNGAQIPFTSTDQKGNFDIGEGFQINQPTSTIRGRDFSKAIQAEVTPLILVLR